MGPDGLSGGGALFAVRDMEASLAFYRDILGLEVLGGFGGSVALSGGLALQDWKTWADSLGKEPGEIRFGGGDAAMCCVAEDFDAFLKVLQDHPELPLAHPPTERRWGQRAVGLYDPDRHVVEVGESLAAVCRRFRDLGLSEEGVARRMGVDVAFVRSQLNKRRS